MSDGDPSAQGLLRKVQKHLFEYPGRQNVGIHQSTISNRTLFYVRLFSFALLTAIYIWGIAVVQQSLFQNVMYLTMIGYFVSWLYFGLCLQDYCLNVGSQPITKGLSQYMEILHQIGFCTELPITLVFWGFLFQLLVKMEGVTTQIIIINGFLHSAPLILLSIDYFLNSLSYPINHLPVIIIFDVVYLIINLSYSLSMKPIYGPIDWVSIGSYVISACSILLTMLVHFIGRTIHKKWKIYRLNADIVQTPLLVPESRSESLRSSKDFASFVQNNDL